MPSEEPSQRVHMPQRVHLPLRDIRAQSSSHWSRDVVRVISNALLRFSEGVDCYGAESFRPISTAVARGRGSVSAICTELSLFLACMVSSARSLGRHIPTPPPTGHVPPAAASSSHVSQLRAVSQWRWLLLPLVICSNRHHGLATQSWRMHVRVRNQAPHGFIAGLSFASSLLLLAPS